MFKELTKGIEILVGQAVFKGWQLDALSSVQIKWSSGRPDAQNCRRTTWTS